MCLGQDDHDDLHGIWEKKQRCNPLWPDCTATISNLMGNISKSTCLEEKSSHLQSVLEVAGKIHIDGFSDEVLKAVEAKLQFLAQNLKTLWDRRQSANHQHQAVLTAFGDVLVQMKGTNEDADFQFVKKMSDKLTILIQSLPQADLFSASDCVNRYVEWNKFWKKSLLLSSDLDHPLQNVHKMYHDWIVSSERKFNEFKELYKIS